LLYIGIIGVLILSIFLILTPYYIAYLIIEPNSFFGVIGVFFLGSIVVPISIGIVKFSFILVGLDFGSLIKRNLIIRDTYIINADSSKVKINKTKFMSLIFLTGIIIVSCIFFMNVKKSEVEPSSFNTSLGMDQSAESPEDLFQLGLSYAYGHDGAQPDYVKAAELIKKSAELGNIEAQYNLGLIYETGEGIQPDYVKAIKWYRKSAEQGNSNAQFSLAMMYLYGRNVSQDNVEAMKWLIRASDQGHSYAQQKLKELQGFQ